MKRHAQDPKGCTHSKSTAEQIRVFRDGMRTTQQSVAPVSWQLLGRPAGWEFLGADWVSGALQALGCLERWCLSWHPLLDRSPPWWPWKCHSITVCLGFACCREVSPFFCTALLMKGIALELIADYTCCSLLLSSPVLRCVLQVKFAPAKICIPGPYALYKMNTVATGRVIVHRQFLSCSLCVHARQFYCIIFGSNKESVQWSGIPA